MTEIPAIWTAPAALLLGLTGGVAHCTAMCGGIVLGFDRLRQQRPHGGLAVSLLHAGRISMYLLLALGLSGIGLSLDSTGFVAARRGWSLLLGAMLVALAAGHWLGKIAGHRLARPISARVRAGMRRAAAGHVAWSFAAGLAWGLIPCMFSWPVIVAAAASPWPQTPVIMTAFGLGTLLPLGLLSAIDRRLGLRWRAGWHRVTSLALAAYGMMMVANAIGVGHGFHDHATGDVGAADDKEHVQHGHHH